MNYHNNTITPCRLKCQVYTATSRKRKIFLSLFLFVSLFFLLTTYCYGSFNKDFPNYPIIQDNVQFWENVYGHYSKQEGIVHDKNNLSIIYEIIPLLDPTLPGATRINEIYRKEVLKKYKALLNNIAKNGKAQTHEEKRIYKLFKGTNKREKIKIAAENLRIQRGLKEKFRDGVIISGKYMSEIKRIFIGHGLPPEIAYLPHVESSFMNNAHSKSGAQGIWQFTKSTGKQYLHISHLIDERKDPIIAADAAARYLKKSYKSLGNWPLTLTSYNYGPAGMKRALNALGNYEKIFSQYNKGYFKFASRNFYSEFLAAYNVAIRFEKSPYLQKENPLRSLYLSTTGYISVASIARHFKVPDHIIAKYNPALLPPLLKGDKLIPKGFKIRLPHTKHAARNLTTIPASDYRKKQKSGGYYRVKIGDTAGSIAIAHKVPLTKLLQINNLSINSKIIINQKLRIP